MKTLKYIYRGQLSAPYLFLFGSGPHVHMSKYDLNELPALVLWIISIWLWTNVALKVSNIFCVWTLRLARYTVTLTVTMSFGDDLTQMQWRNTILYTKYMIQIGKKLLWSPPWIVFFHQSTKIEAHEYKVVYSMWQSCNQKNICPLVCSIQSD
jgi:hypothetical protein